ncbi:MAG: hypothetical protein ABH865_02820 [Candidatus Omnitrophota bacterium]|nr:hypothetical protein [Candidatus Omnitrophota bacterium]
MHIIKENDRYIEFSNRMSVGLRIMLFLFGLLPLFAPYELLIKPRWTGFSLFALLPIIISLGAIAVSVFFLAAALIGLDGVVRFERKKRIVVYGRKALCVRYQESHYSMSDIRSFEIEEREWTDGPKYYVLAMIVRGGKKISFGEFSAQVSAAQYREKLEAAVKGK